VGYLWRGSRIDGNNFLCEITGYIPNSMTRYVVEYTTMGNELTP
jgi:hypothetical protein